DPLAALAGLVKRVLRSQQLGDAVDEGEAFAGEEGSGAVLAVEPRQFRLMFKKLQLAGRPCHVQINDAPGLGGKLGRQDRKGIGGVASEIESSFRAWHSSERWRSIFRRQRPHE